jgi:ribonuclease III
MEKSSPDGRRKAALMRLEGRLSYSFRDITYLEIALTHRSYLNENPQVTVADNERFEFLGDAVLGLCISDLLIRENAAFTEGDLSKIRAALVNEKPLAKLARELEIGTCLLLGKGEESSGGRTKDSLLANSLEAVIAAIYLDSGFTKVKSVIKNMIGPSLKAESLLSQYFDYKTSLQEFCQKMYKVAPQYRLLDSSGPDHARTFAVEVNVADKIISIGRGKSKKEAEKQAAQEAWKELQDEKG